MGTVTAFGSIRSSGVTTLVLALAATWPAEQRVVAVEADPAGGTLAASAGWPAEPGLVSLAAAARRGAETSLVFEHCQHLPGGTPVLAAPARADQARGALRVLAPLLGRLGELDADVLVDCGRLEDTSPVLGVFEGADRQMLVSRGHLADLQAVASWLETHPPGPGPGLVVVGDGPYPDAEIAEALGVPVVGHVPWDPGTPDALVADAASDRRLRMAPLVRSARTLAEHLARDVSPVGAASAVEAVDEVDELGGRPGAHRRMAVGSRVLRARRAETAPHRNGNVPEEAAQ